MTRCLTRLKVATCGFDSQSWTLHRRGDLRGESARHFTLRVSAIRRDTKRLRRHEEVYQQCLERELKLRSIPFEAKKELPIFYKGEKIEKTYIPDLFCFGKIILELKAVGQLGNEHRAQLLNYLRITKCKLGLLVNFGAYPRADIQRYAL